jgi:hypothetical protein
MYILLSINNCGKLLLENTRTEFHSPGMFFFTLIVGIKSIVDISVLSNIGVAVQRHLSVTTGQGCFITVRYCGV